MDYNGADSLQYVVIDLSGSEGVAPADAGTVGITVNAVNDAPVNVVPGPQTVNEDTALVFSSGNNNLIAVSDVDAGTNPVEVHLTARKGTLTLAGTAGLTFDKGNGTADSEMTFTGNITDINAALNGMSFMPDLNYRGAARVKIVTNDQGEIGSGCVKSDHDMVEITVNAINDTPLNSVPSSQTVYVDDVLIFKTASGNRISIFDVDAGRSEVQVTLTATNGALTLSRFHGLTFIDGDGRADSTMTFSGKVKLVNAALNGLKFDPILSGSAGITIITNDLGASGLGGPLADEDTVNITVLNT
ncbi:MAG: hypothetical protein ACOYXY_13385 [Thermodesulfobacteriota bacterium]